MSLIVDNKIIETPIKDIVELLRQQLFLSKINSLNNIERKNTGLRFTCPFHSDGKEKTPSCEILLDDKGDTPAGTVHCFGCGYRAHLVKFIADCLNISYREATQWLLNVSKYSLLEETRDDVDIDFDEHSNAKINWPTVTLDELNTYDNVHPYMWKRKLTDDIINKFDVGYDTKLDALTFPLYVDGKCVLVAKRRVSFKRFDMPKIEPKPIYGLDYLTDNEVIVTESIINALTCWSYGKEAIALCGTGSDWQIDQLNKIRQRKIILALDGDTAGRNGIKRLKRGLTNKIVTVLNLPDGKDINDLSKEEFYELLENEDF